MHSTRCYHTSSYASAVLAVVILSVCHIISHACFVTKPNNALHPIPHERAFTLFFWHQHWLVGIAPFRLKFTLTVTHRLRNTPTSTDFLLITTQR